MQNQRELSVITKAKDLCSYIMIIAQKSPKHFRYTFVSRLKNLSLDIIEKLYRANDVLSKDESGQYSRRLEFQHSALTDMTVT